MMSSMSAVSLGDTTVDVSSPNWEDLVRYLLLQSRWSRSSTFKLERMVTIFCVYLSNLTKNYLLSLFSFFFLSNASIS